MQGGSLSPSYTRILALHLYSLFFPTLTSRIVYLSSSNSGKRTFNDLTGTLLDGSKRSVIHWILATFLLCLSCSSRRIAKELGVHVRTGYRWCWWLRNAALGCDQRSLVGAFLSA